MKLYIKQKVFAFNEQFTIKDGNGKDVYFVSGSLLRIPKKFTITDINGKEVATIERKLFKLFGQYEIHTQTESIVVRRRFGVFRQNFDIEGIDWSLVGDFFDHNYRIARGKRIIMSLAKKWISWGDTYELDILDEQDSLLALCIAICVDYEIEKSRNNNSNSNS